MQALGALGRWPVAHAAAGVLAWDGGAGATPELVGTCGELDRDFAWASVTKLATSHAALVAAEELTLPLEHAVGPPGATAAHLLSHASGLAPGAPTVLAPPGQRRIYSNAGYEWLAGALSQRASMPFATYLDEAVLGPLGMRRTRLPPGASPAAGLMGSLGDLLSLGAELAAPSLVSAATAGRARRVAFPGLAGTLPGFGRQEPCDWGLGPELRGAKRPHWTGAANSPATYGHFGQAGGFVWVDPVARVALAVLTDRDFGPWAAAAWPSLADAVLAEVAAGTA